MFKNSFRMGALALGAILVSSAASAVTVDTFDFTLSTGWTRAALRRIPVADPGATLIGSFTGVVEPDPLGTIALGDLTAFSASFTDSEGFAIGGCHPAERIEHVDFIPLRDTGRRRHVELCPARERRKGQRVRRLLRFLVRRDLRTFTPAFPGANAFILEASGRYGSTADLPTITLVSSVTTPVPEPGSWALFGIGVMGIALIRRGKTRTDAMRSRPLASNNPPCIERALSPQSPRSLKPG